MTRLDSIRKRLSEAGRSEYAVFFTCDIRHLLDLLAESEWVPCSERLPEDGEIVKVYQLCWWAKRTPAGWVAMDDCGNCTPLMWNPDYWCRVRPLPSPPNEDSL